MSAKSETLKAIIDSANRANLERSIMPAPQRFFDPTDKAYKPFLERFDYQPGGRYLEIGPDGPRDVTGEYPAAANISVGPDGKPKFKASQENLEAPPGTKGVKVKTNLFKKKAGWKWTKPPKGYDPEPDGSFPLISVEARGKHYYALETDFPEGVDLSRYASSRSEPRLRPTRKGDVTLGKKVGEISVRGKKHPVYDRAVVKTTAPIAAAGTVGLSSEEAEANPLLDIIDSAAKSGIKAYHGSPHDMPRAQRYINKQTGKSYVVELDNPVHMKIVSDTSLYEPVGEPSDLGMFDVSKIGTGEGAQAYGRGLYFAENEKVANEYRDQLTPRDLDYEDWLMGKYKDAESNQDYARMEMYEKAMMHDKPQDFKDLAADTDYDEDYRELAAEVGQEIEDYGPNLGSMYEVNIDVEPDELLDWYKPLDQQSDKVSKVLSDAFRSTVKDPDGVAVMGFDGEIVDRASNYSPEEWKLAEKTYRKLGNKISTNLDLEMQKIGSGMGMHEALQQRLGGADKVSEYLQSNGVKGVRYADAFTRHKSPDKQSMNYVIFDDRLIEISKKYGISIPLASAVAAGTMTPEEAQAVGVKNIATEGIRSLGQTLEFDSRFDPRKREQEGLQSLRADFLPRNEAMIRPPLRLSDLEGENFVTSMSDRTRAGGMIVGVNDVPLYRAVDMRGGQDFMFENPNQVWASAMTPSRQILELAREFRSGSGKDPIFIPWRMAPTGGDFSNMVGELMLGFASSNMNKTTKKAFDKAIKNFVTKGSLNKGVRKNAGLKIKEWPGVDDPKSVEVWRSTPDTVRKELMNMMDVNFRKEGGLSIGAARLIASDPSQLMSRDAGLQNVGRIYTGREITPSTHPSYPYAVPGEGIGTLEGADEVTIFDLLPEARFGDAQKKVKDSANPTAQEIRALQMKSYGGTITENILRRIEDRGGDVNSLSGLAPGALAFALTSAGLMTPEEAAAGGLDEASEVFGSGMGVKSRKAPKETVFRSAKQKDEVGLPSLVGQLGLGAMSEIGGAILGGAAGVDEYLGGLGRPGGTAEEIRAVREDTARRIGGLYDAGPEAQALGQDMMRSVGETVAPMAEYAMKGPIMDERGLNMVPLIAQKLGIPVYQALALMFGQLPERDQEGLISASDALL